jgi:RHS repeat-associated protein
VAPVPTGATTGSVVATVNGFSTNGATLTVSAPPPPPPSITSVSPTSGSAGAIVTINGSHFGDTQGTSVVRIGGGGGIADVSTWSDTAISVTVPNTATSGPLLVIVNGLVSNGVDFTAPPVIGNLSPSSGIAGTTMTIGGTNFGGTQGSSTISVDGIPATASVWNATSIQVQVPSGAATGDVLVTVNSVPSNPSLFVFNPTNGIITSFRYDAQGQVISTTDPLSHTTSFTYTTGSGAPLGLLETATDSLNNVTRFQYDAAGNRSSMTDPLLNTTTFLYDSMNRPITVAFADGSTNTFNYDLRGRQTDRTDGNGRIMRLTYDDADRVTTITDANQGVTQYSYDTENNLTSITDAQQRLTTFSYDNQRHRVQTTFPSGLLETYVYDPVGNLTSKTDRNNHTINYSYDSINRMTQKLFPDGTAVALNYDALNRLTQAADTTTTLGVSYDNLGHLSASTTQYSFLPGQVFATSMSYDNASRPSRFTAPDGTTNDYSYDDLGRLASLNSSLAGPFAFSYDALDRRTILTRPNGVTTEYSYDPLSRLLSVLHKSGGTILDGASYTLDKSGIRTSKTNHLNNINEQYAYDLNGQLMQVSQGATTSESYTYDAVGNRLSSAASASYAYDASNELTSTSTASYSYDHNGNMVSKTDSSGTTVYNWDFENRLSSIVLPAGGTITFNYDPFGRRIQKSGPGGSIIYLYNEAGMVEELDQTGNPLARYVRGTDDDELLAETRLGTTVYYEQDGLGSVTSLSTSEGMLANTYVYDSFGRLNATAGSAINPFQYTARDFDSETGLQYYRARYYDPTIGRFINEDPIGIEGGINAYAYVHNRPTDLNDPFGLRDVYVAIWNAQNLLSSNRSVGHAAVLETDGQVILSQFPNPHASHGHNVTESWEDTLDREGRDPDRVFKIFVPDDAAFDKVAHERRLRDDWDWKPNSPKETNCVEAADSALLAGGLPLDRYYLWPGYLGDDLQKLSQKKKQGPWKVSPAKVKDIPVVPNADAFPPFYYYPPTY